MTGRIHSFDALDNFRDYGDYATPSGRVKTGRLYRSGHHARLTASDIERLDNLGIGAVVDLRRPSERRAQPSKRPVGFAGMVIESAHDDGGEAPHLTFLKTADLTPESGRRFMVDTYRHLPFENAHVDLFTRYFAALAAGKGPVLIHCAAGKDRTGMLAALTHHLLGVSRDDMMADYLLTNSAVDLEARAPAIARQLETMTGRAPPHDAVTAFLGVEAIYLETALAEITARSGSVDAYLQRALGVDRAQRDRIVAWLAG